MTSAVKTFLIKDTRLDLSNEISVGVKSGPATSSVVRTKLNSNSSSNVAFNVTVSSQNTLVNRAPSIETTLNYTYTFGANGTGSDIPLNVVPSAFPLHNCIQSNTTTVNNTTLSAQVQDLIQPMLKSYNQKYLSKNNQTTPNYVDKYFGLIADASADEFPSSYMNGIKYGEKDSDIVARADCDLKITLFNQLGVAVAVPPSGVLVLADASVAGFFINVELKIREKLMFLPCFEMEEDVHPCLVGIDSINLNIQLNDASHLFYVPPAMKAVITAQSIGKRAGGGNLQVSTLLSENSYISFQNYTVHPSEYQKLSTKNITPYNEFNSYKTTYVRNVAPLASSFSILSNNIALSQMPDKIYIAIMPQYSSMSQYTSNHLAFPITKLIVSMNNRMNVLAEYNAYDLYMMSRNNGIYQSFQEFRGVVRDNTGAQYTSLGSVVCIDAVKNLCLEDYLTDGSLASLNLQIDVTCDELYGASANANLRTQTNLMLNIICSKSGVLVTEQGQSSQLNGLLTKVLVLDAKEGGASVSSEEVKTLEGGNVRHGLTSLSKHRNAIGRGAIAGLAQGGNYVVTGGSSGLSKYT